MVSLEHYLTLATIVFLLGAMGVMFRRNLIMVLMSLELMLTGVSIIFVAAAVYLDQVDGQLMAVFIMAVAACEAAVGLAMVIALFRRYGTINTDFLRVLRG